jgi:prenyltransferase beta subunit
MNRNISSIDAEKDMRFVYCAAAVCQMLGDFEEGMDVELVVKFICSSQRYDGGISQGGTKVNSPFEF